MSKLTEQEKIRRVAILCMHFTRNLAYYRAIWDEKKVGRFWVTIHDNFRDICVVEWCKLFGDNDGARNPSVHDWRQVAKDPVKFEQDLWVYLKCNKDDYEKYRGGGQLSSMRFYRDKFVGHLDEEKEGCTPHMDLAYKAVCFYYDHIVKEISSRKDFPNNMESYYQDCYKEVANHF